MDGLARELLNDILHYFDLSDEEKDALCAFSREIVKNEYSACEMARKTEQVYYSALQDFEKNRNIGVQKPKKIAICGYYGHENFGDEAILRAILSCLDGTDLQNSAILPRKSHDIRIISVKNPIKTARDMLGADLFIFGGGSLLQNCTSDRSLLCYLLILFAANAVCKRKIMLANGFGPIRDGALSQNTYLFLISMALSRMDLITVRDGLSLRALKELIPERKIIKIEDPSLIELSKINSRLCRCGEKALKKRYFAFFVNARTCAGMGISDLALALALEKMQKEMMAECVIAVLNPEEDMEFAKLLARRGKMRIFVPKKCDMLCTFLKKCDFSLSQRYHGALYSLFCALPTLVLSNDPKLTALCVEKGALRIDFHDITDLKNKINMAKEGLTAANFGVSEKKIIAIIKKYLN